MKASEPTTLEPVGVPATATSQVAKRLQVPKACTNCRKMHAGCDTTRPCKRCKQNGLESTCSDIPRKKRASRKKQKSDEPEPEPEPFQGIPSSAPQPTSGPSYVEAVPITEQVPRQSRPIWENTTPPNHPSPTSNPTHGEQPFETVTSSMSPLFSNDFNLPYQQQDTLFTDYNESYIPPPGLTPSSGTTPTLGTPSSQDINFLIHQVNELRENNKALESKLSGVSYELADLKGKGGKPLESGYSSSNWHSFQPQQDLAISVWKNVGYSSNVLVECNNKFVELLGFPMETLKNNFSCAKLIKRDSDYSRSNGREWPKRTQIVTAEGLKDVFMTINPVSDQNSIVKYYVLHILEVHS